MLFTGLILLFLGAIAFIHYLQGFFSATISAILTIVAAVFAFSYHETIVESFLAGKLNDTANAIALLAMFALIYLILRIIFDAAVPGNVRVPVAVDKAGAAVMGVIAGIFATGIMAIAAQELPFGPSIAGFTRFDTLGTRTVKVDIQGRGMTSATWDELSAHDPGEFGEPGQVGHGVPILPVDDIVVGMVNRLSSPSGALEDGKPLTSVHPDFLDETFGQRLGMETTGGHVSVNSSSQHLEQVRVLGLFKLDPGIKQLDEEYTTVRNGGALKPIKLKANEMFLVVRTMISSTAADKDGFFRFSPAACRLVVDRPEGVGEEPGPTDLYPIGTLQGTDTLYLDKIDDFLLMEIRSGGKAADLVYVVDKKLWDTAAPPGTFLEVKRMARVDLSGEKVSPTLTADPQVDVMRKYYILHPEENPEIPHPPVPATPPRGAPAPSRSTPAPAPAPDRRQPRGTPQGQAMESRTSQSEATTAIQPGLFSVDRAEETSNLGFAMAVAGAREGELAKVGTGTVSVQDGKLKTANFDILVHDIPRGRPVSEFLVPAGQVMIRITGMPPRSSTYAFITEPEQYELVDSQGKHYQPNGYYAQYGGPGGGHLRLQYIDSTSISGSALPEGATGLARLFLYYNVPTGVTITDFFDHGQKAAAVRIQKAG